MYLSMMMVEGKRVVEVRVYRFISGTYRSEHTPESDE